MTYQPPRDDRPDTAYQGAVLTRSGKLRMQGDPKRYRVVVGESLEIAARLTLDQAMARAIAVIQRGRYPNLEVSIKPAIDFVADYRSHGHLEEYEARRTRNKQRKKRNLNP